MTEAANGQDQELAGEAQRWVARLASGEMDDAELARLKAWRAVDPAHNRAFEDQRALWRALGDGVGVRPAGRSGQRQVFRPRRSVDARALRGRSRIRMLAGIAAAIVAAVAFGPELLMMLRADHRAGVAVESFTLPDGSVVALDAGAAIAVHYDDAQRSIELLRGDAWFEVAHDDPRPFRVSAQDGIIQDIGTAFEVRLDGGATIVTVTEGAVRVSPGGGDSVVLTETERVRYQDDGALAHLPAVPTGEAATWRRGEVLIQNEAPREAVARIARYRRMPVYLLGAWPEDVRVSGVFRTDRPDEAIDAVARMAGLDMSEVAGVILLRSVH